MSEIVQSAEQCEENRTQRGTKVAMIGAVVGLVPAAGLGSLRFLNAEPPVAVSEIAGNIAFALIYLSPYALAAAASRVRDPSVRGGFLIAIGLLSLAASFSAFLSLVSIVLLPATIVIWVAAVRSLRAAGRARTIAMPAFGVGLSISVLIGFGFFTLFLVQEPEARCWVLTLGTDGQYHWESRPNVSRNPGGLSAGLMGGYDRRGVCTSDVITNAEAAITVGVLSVAFLGSWGFMAWARRRPTPVAL